MRDLPNLDLLRACAVLSVVLEHVLLAYNVTSIGSWQIRWLGIAGVMVFFVHTSLVLMWSLERKPHTLDFYIRRIFRIYPLALAAICATLAFHAPVTGATNQYFHFQPPWSKSALLGAVTLLPNLTNSYLPMSVMWSLPYEVEMYLFLPVLFFFVRKNFALWPLLLFWTFAAALGRQLFPGVAHNFVLVVPYFLPGIMAYVGFERYRARFPAWAFVLFLPLIWVLFMPRATWRSGNLVCLGVGLALPMFRQITNRPLIVASHTVAKYSYGMYLAHPFGIVLGLYLMPHSSLALQLTVIVLSTAALSVGAYHLLEHPMVRLGSRLAKRLERRYSSFEQEHFHRIPSTQIR